MKRFNPEKIGELIARSLLLEQGFAKEEEARQDKLSSKIDKLKLRAPKDSGEETITDEDDDANADIDPKPKPESKSKANPKPKSKSKSSFHCFFNKENDMFVNWS